MIPVSRSSSLPTMTQSSSRRDVTPGLSRASSDLYAVEAPSHALLTGSNVYQERFPQKSPTVPMRATNYPKPGSRNKFQELLEADAVARAAMEASKRPSSIPAAEEPLEERPGGNNGQNPAASKEEVTFAISVLGNRIKLSITPKNP